jgi:hypothetical protein
MANLAESDVTITLVDKDFFSIANVLSIFNLAFGDSAKTYPTGGVPVGAIGKFGFNKTIKLALIEDAPADGYVRKFDRANMKIKYFYADYDAVADGALIEVPDASVALADANVRIAMIGE